MTDTTFAAYPVWENYAYQLVRADTMVIVEHGETGYQRGEGQSILGAGKPGRMAARFDQEAFKPLILSFHQQCPLPHDNRRNVYHVLDGARRLRAFRRAFGPNVPIPALVLGFTGSELSLVDEARRFWKFEVGHLNQSSRTKFKARLAGKEPTALDILRIFEELEIPLRYSTNEEIHADNRYVVSALDAVERVYKWSPLLLTRAMAIMRETWQSEVNGYRGNHILGLAMFLCRYPTLLDGEIVARFRLLGADNGMRCDGLGVESLYANSHTMKAVYRKDTVAECAGRALHLFWNQGRREGDRLSEWANRQPVYLHP